jgi:copper chaperone CopZ
MLHTEFNIINVKCSGCENQINSKIKSIDGVEDIKIDVENSRAALTYNNEAVLNEVEETLSKMGYPISEEDNSVFKKAKSYLSCMIGRISEE